MEAVVVGAKKQSCWFQTENRHIPYVKGFEPDF